MLAATPNHPDALANLANIQFGREDFAAAAESYQRAFAIRRDAPAGVWVRRALAQRRQRRHGGRRGQPARSRANRARRYRRADQSRLGLRREAPLGGGRAAAAARAGARSGQSLCAVDARARAPAPLRLVGPWTSCSPSINRQLEDGDATHRHPANPFPVLAMPTSPRAQLHAAERWARGFAPSPPLPRPTVTLATASGCASASSRRTCASIRWRTCRSSTGSASIAAGSRLCAYSLLPRQDERDRTAGRRRLRSLCRRQRRHADVDRAAHPQRPHRHPVRPQRLYDALARAPVRAAPGADPDQFDRLSRHAGRRLVRLHPGRPLRRAGSDAAVTTPSGSGTMPHSFYPSDTTRAPRGTAPSRARMRSARERLRVLLLQQGLQDPAGRLRDLDATAGRGAGQRAVAARKRTRRRAAICGAKPRRAGVDPGGWYSLRACRCEEHLARHAAADLFVDTFPYGAHTTTNDALLAGLAGPHLRRRNAGQPHCRQPAACDRPAGAGDERASPSTKRWRLRLAREPATLAALRARLAANRHTHPLFDMARYTRDFEALLLRTWDERHRLDP